MTRRRRSPRTRGPRPGRVSSGGRLLLGVAAALAATAVVLVASTVFDAPWLGWVAAGLLLLALAGRGVRLWGGRAGVPLALVALAVIAGFLWERLGG